MNEAPQKGRVLSGEEKQRLASFFSILMKIDRRVRITPTAKKMKEGSTS